jgi:hypothetical protein
MAHELVPDFGDISQRNLDIAAVIGKILPRGHVIHGYSTANSTRLMMVLESTKYSDSAPLLGYGADGYAERALARALLTYALREQQGLDYIIETQLPESTKGKLPSGNNNSRFDNIVWSGDFRLHQEGQDYVAWSGYGGGSGGLQPIEVRAASPIGAIESLAETYDFNPSVRALPAISLDYVPFH